MPRCPQCQKPLAEITRRCPSCRADLDLLVDYVSHLEGGLQRAENLVRAGELSQAVWAYLEVLEVDPDNALARKQVGQVATAVRQFDRTAPGRRWLSQMRSGVGDTDTGMFLRWLRVVLVLALVVFAFLFGLSVGTSQLDSTDTPVDKKPPTLSGK